MSEADDIRREINGKEREVGRVEAERGELGAKMRELEKQGRTASSEYGKLTQRGIGIHNKLRDLDQELTRLRKRLKG